MDAPLTLAAIGVIRSPFRQQEGTPICPAAAEPADGTVEVLPPYRGALQDLAGFERIWLLYWFDRARPFSPLVVPYRDTIKRGLFATRAPARPNPIGISAVRLVSVNLERGELEVQGLDVLDGTPLLDLKPYIPEFDAFPLSRAGWMDEARLGTHLADGRFER